jgi:pimeloyl-ACP methyl ester carboxylesterase
MIDRYTGWHLAYADPGTAPETPVAQVQSHISPDFQAIARRLGQKMPRAEPRTIADSGHMSNMEAPELFNELVLEFLQRH